MLSDQLPSETTPFINQGQYIDTVHGNAIHNTYLQRLLATLQLTDEYIDQLTDSYVEPRDHHDILETLQRNRIAVLVGSAGAGRITTAICTLSRLSHSSDVDIATSESPRLALKEVRRGLNDTFDVAGLVIDGNTGYILDMRADDEPAPPSFGRSLYDLKQTLTDKGSYLIVAMSASLWLRVAAGASFLGVMLTGPTPEQVFSGYLKTQRAASYWLDDPTIADAISQANAGGAVRIAEIVNAAESSAQSAMPTSRTTEDKHDLLATVHAALKSWRNELIEWSNRPRSSEVYGFMLVSALLAGGSSAIIYSLALQLAAELESTPINRGLSAPGVVQLAHQIEAEVSDLGAVTFLKPGYAAAALEFFLVNRPDFVERFHDWLIRLPAIVRGMAGLNGQQQDESRNRAAAFLTERIIRGEDMLLLRKVIDAWGGEDSTLVAAADVVTAVALSPGFGRVAREETRDWCANPSRTASADARALAVAEACRGQLGRVAPGITIKRLEHLANRNDPRLEPILTSALTSLYSSTELRRVLIKETGAWAKDAPSTASGASRIYLALLGKQVDERPLSLLLADTRDQDENWLVSAWASVLSSAEHEVSSRRVISLWLETAWQYENLAERMIRIFARAVWSTEGGVGSETRQARLLAAAFFWAPPEKTEKDDLRNRLIASVTQARPSIESERPGREFAA